MTARKDLIDMETRRTKRLRILSLPFTLFLIPERLRIFSISLMKKILGNKKHDSVVQSYDFDVNDVCIHHDKLMSINLFVIAEKDNASTEHR